MKCVVITGSARGLGLEMAKCFRRHNFNVVISDLFLDDLKNAVKEITSIKGRGEVTNYVCDVTSERDVATLINKVVKKYGCIDIWINNAGVNQPDKLIWELNNNEVKKMLEIDLYGTMIASKMVIKEMISKNKGAIYNVEGHGSNDAIIPGLSIYGTAKRGITYFTSALAKEVEGIGKDVIVGKLSPGIMITDFTVNAFRDKKIKLSSKNKRVYNILGDKPDVVAKFLVEKMINNTQNNVCFSWLTNRKAMFRFMFCWFNKRDFFKEKD